jgi:FAD dependent oxidoreductase TIGR03364
MKQAIVVGGGILGTWHAIALTRAGYTVQHLEADAAPGGASVRNFGLLWVSGRRSGPELEVARQSRRLWQEMAEVAPGIGFRANGSLTLARTAGERSVMEDFAAQPDASERAITFVEPHECAAINPAVRGAVTGALHCVEDAVVEPRSALGALRGYLNEQEGYAFHTGRRVVVMEENAVVDSTGTRWEGDVVVLATGAAFDHLPGTEHLSTLLRRVRLQMLETAPFASQLSTSLADADSLRYYPAYEVVDRESLGLQSPVASAHQLQLLLVQRLDGGLTIGDTHTHGEPFDFALSEEPSDELLARASALLGTPLPPVTRRWEGVYPQCIDGDICFRHEVSPGVWLVTGPGGRGMTCAPGIANGTLSAVGA